MEIHVKQTEIEAALRQYLTNQGTNLTGRAISIIFTSGRNPSGLTAAIDIGDVTEVVVPAKTVQYHSGETCGTAELPKAEEGTGLVPDDAHSPEPETLVQGQAETSGEEKPAENPVSLFS